MSKDRFKFRVFDKEYKDYLPEGVLLDGRTGKVSGVNVDRYTIEQCTGLTDKNGKLIYEGDVITIADDDQIPEEYEIFCVKWAKAYSGELFCAIDKKGELQSFYGGIPLLEYARIIGNIHKMEGI